MSLCSAKRVFGLRRNAATKGHLLMDQKQQTRQSNFELLRIAAMFFILCFHCVFRSIPDSVPLTFSGYLLRSFFILGKFGVNLYILISGYFMVKSHFRWKKVILLLGELCFYNLFVCVGSYLLKADSFSIPGLVRYTLKGFSFPWFLTVYLMVYILSPYLKRLILKLTQTELKRMIVTVLLIWSLFPTAVSLFNGGKSETLLYYSDFIIFVIIYIIGAYLRLYPSGVFKTKKSSAAIAIFSYACVFAFMFVYDKFSYLLNPKVPMYFVKQNSVFIILLSVGVFCIFKDMTIKSSKIINTIASTTLGVYLLHDNGICQTFLWEDLLHMETRLSGRLPVLCVIGICACIFLCGIAIDLVRQFIEKHTLAKILNSKTYLRIESKIRSAYYSLLNKT